MNDVVKAARAINHVLALLKNNQERRAVKLIEMAYQCSPEEATDFVYSVKDACAFYPDKNEEKCFPECAYREKVTELQAELKRKHVL